MNEYELMSLEEKAEAFSGYIQIAADSVSKLRRCDIDRVMEQAQSLAELRAISEYLFTVRPDFDVAEVCEIENDIAVERDWGTVVRG